MLVDHMEEVQDDGRYGGYDSCDRIPLSTLRNSSIFICGPIVESRSSPSTPDGSSDQPTPSGAPTGSAAPAPGAAQGRRWADRVAENPVMETPALQENDSRRRKASGSPRLLSRRRAGSRSRAASVPHAPPPRGRRRAASTRRDAAAADEHVLPAVELVGDRRVADAADAGVPQRRAVAVRSASAFLAVSPVNVSPVAVVSTPAAPAPSPRSWLQRILPVW